jgi:hypothetical protein
MNQTFKTILIIVFLAFTANAEFIVQSAHTNDNCDTTQGYGGNAVTQNFN